MCQKLVLVFSEDFSTMCVMSITPMKHVPEIGAKNRYQKTGSKFCSMVALFYSPVDMTDASDLHQSVQV